MTMQEYKTIKYLDETAGTTTGFAFHNENGGELTLSVSGTFVATIVVEGGIDDTWYQLAVIDLKTLDTATTITTAGTYAVAGVGGFESIRVGVSEFTSGKITAIGKFNY